MQSKTIGLVLILVFLLAGCSTTTQIPVSLHVTRSESLPGYYLPPFERTVNTPTAVQQVYAAALALPTPGPGVYHCPNDVGLVYHLDFYGNGFTFHHMDLDATGCRWLHLNQTEVRQTTDSFMSLVVQTIGIPCLFPPACASLKQ